MTENSKMYFQVSPCDSSISVIMKAEDLTEDVVEDLKRQAEEFMKYAERKRKSEEP